MNIEDDTKENRGRTILDMAEVLKLAQNKGRVLCSAIGYLHCPRDENHAKQGFSRRPKAYCKICATFTANPDRQELVKDTITCAAVVAKTTSVHTVASEGRPTSADTIEIVDSDTDEEVLMRDQPLLSKTVDEGVAQIAQHRGRHVG